MYILRLDDFAQNANVLNWKKMEELCEKYKVKPLVGIIPLCADKKIGLYTKVDSFWGYVKHFETIGWVLAMHGCTHVFKTKNFGMNPVNCYSEFAGIPLCEQRYAIKSAYDIFKKHNLYPKVFFAPAHTFDENTLLALEIETNIRIISDTVANNYYRKGNFVFVPQQVGKCRALPLKVVTFCYHPNTMTDKDFQELEIFLAQHNEKFMIFPTKFINVRELTLYDKILEYIYFKYRTIRNKG